jgi:hypothetical protein
MPTCASQVRTLSDVARRHHDIAEELRRAVEDHEATCHALPAGCSHYIEEGS